MGNVTLRGVKRRESDKYFAQKAKKPRIEILGFFIWSGPILLELRFLVDDVLTCNRVKLGNFHLARRRTLVLRRRVEVTRTSSRCQLDLFAVTLCHGELLLDFAAGAEIR